MLFEYDGDDGDRILAWFRERLRAIGSCLSTEHPEAVLALVYSGFDTLGFLAAAQGIDHASRKTFKDWCAKYVLARLQSVEGYHVTAADLYGARCGILHTSTPISDGSRDGEAHEVWYQFQGKAGVNLIADTRLEPLGLEIEKLAIAFREAGIAFITDINNDPISRRLADDRADNFLRWGTAHLGTTTAV